MISSRIPFLWRERMASPLTWHYAGFAVLLAAVIFLSIRFGLDWSATDRSSTGALVAKQMQLKLLEKEIAPLRGLDKRIDDSRVQMSAFYTKRIPRNYSSIATRIGELALKGPVRLARVQYSQGVAGSDLTEIVMDASITGEYPQIMRFVNSLERNQTFFVIRGMQLTGQQGGLVNLRLRVSTWLRPADVPSGLAPTTQSGDGSAAPAKAEKEGE
jgi:Tfp pilus assembly protein PilO